MSQKSSVPKTPQNVPKALTSDSQPEAGTKDMETEDEV